MLVKCQSRGPVLGARVIFPERGGDGELQVRALVKRNERGRRVKDEVGLFVQLAHQLVEHFLISALLLPKRFGRDLFCPPGGDGGSWRRRDLSGNWWCRREDTRGSGAGV